MAPLIFLSPLSGAESFLCLPTHGSRRGLHSCAASRLTAVELRSTDSRGRLSPHGSFREFRYDLRKLFLKREKGDLWLEIAFLQ
jgi:hypothetical protein